jgi:hypothetical protein
MRTCASAEKRAGIASNHPVMQLACKYLFTETRNLLVKRKQALTATEQLQMTCKF